MNRTVASAQANLSYTSKPCAGCSATKVYNPMGNGSNDRGLSRKHIMDEWH